MNALQETLHRLNILFNKVTDWLLIVIGVALIVKASLAIDVALARYVIIGVGVLLVCIGLWYRHRRKQRHR
jgi:predicted tellurium resistance membrane protein TerC